MEHMYDVKPDSFPGVSEEMDKRACRAMNATWDAIAMDVLVNDEGRYDETKCMWRSEVLELVLDAGHMDAYGEDKEAAAYTIWVKWNKPTYWKKLSKMAFPSARYGS